MESLNPIHTSLTSSNTMDNSTLLDEYTCVYQSFVLQDIRTDHAVVR